MSPMSESSSWRRSGSAPRLAHRPNRRTPRRLEVEQLEDRTALSGMTWGDVPPPPNQPAPAPSTAQAPPSAPNGQHPLLAGQAVAPPTQPAPASPPRGETQSL